MNSREKDPFRTVVAFAPVVFAAHFAEARRRGVSSAGLLAALGLGALPMLIQGYLVIFRGTRLF